MPNLEATPTESPFQPGVLCRLQPRAHPLTAAFAPLLLVAMTAVALMLAGCTAQQNITDASAAATATPGPTPTATVFATAVPRNPETPTATATGEISPAAALFTGAEPIADPASLASIERVLCPFETPPRTRPDCYDLRVPENWADPGTGRTVTVPVAVFPATGSSTAADPLVYLEGGPGGNALSLTSFTYDAYFKPMAADREVIVFDQRGAGLSDPALNCALFDQVSSEELSVLRSIEEEDRLVLEALTACRTELSNQNIDLSQYNSSASATDLEAMRALLGYEQWNLLGVSYGSRLAQTSMRLYPNGIRSVILDSIVPVADDRAAVFAPNGAAAFERLFDGCRQDQACTQTYPNLERRFFDLVNSWNESAVSFDGQNTLTGDDLTFLIDGDDLMSLAYGALYSRGNFSAIPEIVDRAELGDFTLLSALASSEASSVGLLTSGMFISVNCAEEAPFSDPDLLNELTPADERYEWFADRFNARLLSDVCSVWDVTAVDPVENAPVESAIPALLMGGRYDPITPADATSLLAETLANAQTVIFNHEGHGLSSTECGLSLVQAFVADPTASLDTRCVDDSPAPFWVSDLTGPITPAPFTENGVANALTGVRPQEWTASGGGTFYRNQNAADPAFLLIQQSFDLAASTIFSTLAEPFNWDALPTFAETRVVDDVEWSVFRGEFERSTVIAAVSEAGADSILIIVSGYPDDFPRFEEEVFEPALVGTRPL